MLPRKPRGTVISEGLKVEGNVTSQELVEVYGQIHGDMNGTCIVVGPSGEIRGAISADEIVVDGRVEGPIHGADVILKANAVVKGSLHHRSLVIEKGAHFEGSVIPLGATAAEAAPAERAAGGRAKAKPAKAAAAPEPPRQAAE